VLCSKVSSLETAPCLVSSSRRRQQMVVRRPSTSRCNWTSLKRVRRRGQGMAEGYHQTVLGTRICMIGEGSLRSPCGGAVRSELGAWLRTDAGTQDACLGEAAGFSVPLFHRLAIFGCERRRSRRLSGIAKDKRIAFLQEYARSSARQLGDSGNRVTVVH